MKKHDILFICQFFYPEYVSSATLPYDTAVALNKEGFNVGVLCGYPKEYVDDKTVPSIENHDGIRIKRLKYIQLKRSGFFGRLINYFSFTLSVLFRLRIAKQYESIIVYSNPPVLPLASILANFLYGTKIIFVSYDVYPEIAINTGVISNSGLITKLMQKINKLLFTKVHTVVALSSEMRDYLVENREPLQREQIEVIPNWYENTPNKAQIDSWSNSKFQQYSPDNFLISYLGNMGIAQDMETLIAAIQDLKNKQEVKFLLAGHGNKLSMIRDIVQAEQLNNVSIFDFLHGADFEDALNISDVLVVTLAKNVDGLAVPSKTYSYLKAGKPVIAIMDKNSDIAVDLLFFNAGYVVAVGDTAGLTRSILALKDDATHAKEVGENARKLFEMKYTREICTASYVKMFFNILGETNVQE